MNVSGKMNPFETTRSGKGYVKKIKEWKNQGYGIIIYFLKLPSAEFAIERVKLRVAKAGHNVPVQMLKDAMREAGIISAIFISHWLIHG